ncbi:MAG: hypothetical protein SNJ55_01720 [Chloroherpetonaceae bacterium]
MKTLYTLFALVMFLIVSAPTNAHHRSLASAGSSEWVVEAAFAQSKSKSKSSTKPRGPMPSAKYYEMKRNERRNKRIESVGDRERARKAAEKAKKKK